MATNLMQGFAAGQAIGGGLRTAFSDRPAAEKAMKQIQQGADPNAVLQQLYSTNPRAAEMLAGQIGQMQTQQANQMQLKQAQQQMTQRQKTQQAREEMIGQVGDDPMLQFYLRDPETAGLITRYKREKTAQQRTNAAAPLLGAVAVQNPAAKRRLIDEAANNIKSFSPGLADRLMEHETVSDEQLDAFVAPVVQVLGQTGFIPKKPGEDNKTANIMDYEYYAELLASGNVDAANRFANAANLNPRERVNLKIEETRGKEVAKQQTERAGEAIGKGLRQAGAIGGINRAVELLDKVNTGGYASAKKFVTDFLGTTPADEAEFAYLTGKNVLGQLKDVFGAQFTNEEAKRLERLEAGLGRSVEANRSILKRAKETAVSAAKRGYIRAVQQGDEWAANDIAMQLRAAGEEVPDVQGGQQPGQMQQQASPTGKTADDYINEARGGN